VRGRVRHAHVGMPWSRALRCRSMPSASHRLALRRRSLHVAAAAPTQVSRGSSVPGSARNLASASSGDVGAGVRGAEGAAAGKRAGDQEQRQRRQGLEPPVEDGPELRGRLGGPILADFLAMGAGRSVGPPPLAPAPRPLVTRPAPRLHNAFQSPSQKASEAPVRERRLIVAALRQGEALSQDTRDSPPRAAVQGLPLRAQGRVPQLFEEGFCQFMESRLAKEATQAAQAAQAAEELEQNQEGGVSASAPRKERLRVMPWHREALQKMLCRALVFQFLQDMREKLSLQTGQPPLWFWEARRAQEYSVLGEVTWLVKFLAETELHIVRGKVRSSHFPGSMPKDKAQNTMREERRQLVQELEEAGQRLSSRSFEEDAFLRIFLDGRLSWPRVRDHIGLSPLLQVPELAESSASVTAEVA
jgi:hypothetical protein